MCGKEIDPYFEYRFRLAWEHFRFHAEQRTKVFHFFIILSGAILAAVGFLDKDNVLSKEVWMVFLAASFVASIFMALDVRNTQLLEQSEDILRKLEAEYLFKDCKTDMIREGTEYVIALGILSRERILLNNLNKNHPLYKNCITRLFIYNNLKHKTNIRIIIFSIFLTSGGFALKFAPEGVPFGVAYWLIVAMIIWIWHAWMSPSWHIKLENEAFNQANT